MRKKRAFRYGFSERGSILILTLIAVTVMGVIGASAGLMMQAEIKSLNQSSAYERALLAGESGIEYYYFAKTAYPGDNCFPFNSDGTVPAIFEWEEPILAGSMDAPVNCGVAEGGADRDPSDPDPDDLPCRPYDEALLGEYGHVGDDLKQNRDPWNPLGVWPDTDFSGDFGEWKDINLSQNEIVSTSNASDGAGMRFNLGFFTVCNEDYRGSLPAGTSPTCTTPPCNTQVIQFEVVSTGEVTAMNGAKVRRAVKVDFTGPFMYAGVIDKYVDLTLAIEMDINGPVHINGWYADGQYQAFYMTLDASFVPLLAAFDPPEVVSVSYPEDPMNPDWQPSFFGFSFGNINYVHLPVRIEIPSVNWDKWEDRMKQLFDESLSYGEKLVRKDQYPSGITYNYPDADNIIDNPEKLFGVSLNFDCPTEHRGGKIINCFRQGTWETWNADTFVDLYDPAAGGADTGSEVLLGQNMGSGKRNKSMQTVSEKYVPFDPSNWTLSCNAFDDSGCTTTIDRPDFRFAGQHRITANMYVDGATTFGYRTPFHTCGPGDGTRTLYCIHFDSGELWGSITFWSEFSIFGIITIPEFGIPASPTIEFGVPHWHTGTMRIEGEVLVNGYLQLSDYIDVYGGALYADEDIVKDETSALDLVLEVDALLCAILGLIFTGIFASLCLYIFRGFWIIQDLLNALFFGFLDDILGFLGVNINSIDIFIPGINVIIQSISGMEWWPSLDLTNNGLIDFYTYLDINGTGSASVPNSGTMYTAQSFRYEEPSGASSRLLLELIGLLMNVLGIGQSGTCLNGGIGAFGFCLKPAVDPLRIGGEGAIVARDDIEFNNHPRMDVLSCKYDDADASPDNRTDCDVSTGYLFAGRKVQIPGDVGGKYSEAFGLIPTSSPDSGSAFTGIFYGYDRVTSRDCINPEAETADFTAGLPDTFGCWSGSFATPGSDWLMQGHIYAGKVNGIPQMQLTLDQDPTVRNAAINLNYLESSQLITPVAWSEVLPPSHDQMPSFDE